MLAELTYQPPPPPESTLEPSCAWHGRSNPMASPMAPPRALDPFSHHNLPAPSAFPSTTQERGTPTPGAAHSSAGGTSRNPLVGATIRASAQADHVLAAGETIGAGDDEVVQCLSRPASARPSAGLGFDFGKIKVSSTESCILGGCDIDVQLPPSRPSPAWDLMHG
ncbi:hypothetical protein HPB50_015337 [Hyalomma asiaticum]|uniref:Uncharacterized protein n=1 Tax=Hyalomma asiaticum TaxID=266040 RepID=A0ACB7SYL9_HYAAI|nr:hypothetical protein HPB50_015337 [Hyalomma asiaticum]